MIDRFDNSQRLAVAITPEGTRSRVTKWHTGFLNIAREAGVPIVLGAIDFKKKEITITRTFTPSDDNERDMAEIKKYYRQFTGKYPNKFCAD